MMKVQQIYDGIMDTETGTCYHLSGISGMLNGLRELPEMKFTTEESYHLFQTAVLLERLAKVGNQKRPVYSKANP